MRIFATAVLLAGISTPALATTFIDGTVNAAASVTLGNLVDVGATTGPSSTAGPGTVASTGFGSLADGGYSVSSGAFVSGNWASADAGTIDIQWGWDIATGGSGLVTQANTNVAIPNWRYTFIATGNGTFAGRYNVVGSGDTTFGLQPIYGSDDFPFGPYGGDVNDPTGSGSFSVALVNGQTYTMSMFNFGNLTFNSGGDANASARALIDWQISYDVVPEPASWAMMITGFGLVGAGMRRRRMVAA